MKDLIIDEIKNKLSQQENRISDIGTQDVKLGLIIGIFKKVETKIEEKEKEKEKQEEEEEEEEV